ncbi:MAG: hypothetical protein GOVbin1753_2 [Prokaryotic dsDNA virus sp.]|nr:MAG: hypothetical protein GOVbin1753_2 [Prokaryotic dsDNA virus sp.]|tara:strand:+ start:1551 stop:1754 length:204 start_codon:yes stop_codon:yes gene_type:complete
MKLIKNDWQRQLKDDLREGRNRPMFPQLGGSKVKVCKATLCTHNENERCMLESINVNEKGMCTSYSA